MRLTGIEFDKFVARVYSNKVNSCRDSGLEFSLSLTQVKNMLRAKRCQYSGVELTHCASGVAQKDTDVTIDRIDNSKGYITGNVLACSKAMNSLKGVIENPSNASTLEGTYKMCKKLNKLGMIK